MCNESGEEEKKRVIHQERKNTVYTNIDKQSFLKKIDTNSK